MKTVTTVLIRFNKNHCTIINVKVKWCYVASHPAPQCALSGFQWTRVALKAICTLNLSADYLHNLAGEISEVTHNQTNIAALLLSQMEKHSCYKKLVTIKCSSFRDRRT